MHTRYIAGTLFLCFLTILVAGCSDDSSTDPGGGGGAPGISGIRPPALPRTE